MAVKVLRWGLIGLVGTAVLLLLARWSYDRQAQAQVSGRLTVSSVIPALQNETVGDFEVRWTNDHALQIVHKSNPDKLLWSSIPGQPFIGAGHGTANITEALGLFKVSDKRDLICAGQTIELIKQEGSGVTIEGLLTCRAGQGPFSYRMRFMLLAENQLGFTVAVQGYPFNRTYLTYASAPDEHFFGFGTQFSAFDMKGRRLPIVVSEQGVGRGEQPITAGADLTRGAGGEWHSTYAPVPHYITSQMRSLFLENSEVLIFDLRSPDKVFVEIFAAEVHGRLLAGDSPAALIESYTSSTGRMRPLPDWVHKGAIIGMQGGTERVREVWQRLKQAGTPVSAFWLQDWSGQRETDFGKQLWWNWELDRERYPDWDVLVADVHAAGARMMIYINPFLTDVSEKPGRRRNMWQEALDQGFLVRDAQGNPYEIATVGFPVGLLDLTNPQAVAWYQAIIRDEMLAIGADGWMADFGEGLPFDAQLFSEEDASRVHNRYPELWAQVNRAAIEENGRGEDALFFMRSGFTNSPRYSTLFWLGDQLVSWDANDGIKTAVTGLLSSGLSGYAFNHSDIGGYTTINNPLRNYHRSRELLWRWMELNAFTAVFRTHEGNLPEANAQFYDDPQSMAFFSRNAQIYAAWGFYRRQLVNEAAQTGLPVVRHLFIHYPEDPVVYDLSYEEFLVGTELLLAPVLDPGVNEVRVYLPAGEWVHMWSGAVYGSPEKGQWVRVSAPLGEPALFYQVGSAVGEQFRQNLLTAGLLRPS